MAPLPSFLRRNLALRERHGSLANHLEGRRLPENVCSTYEPFERITSKRQRVAGAVIVPRAAHCEGEAELVLRRRFHSLGWIAVSPTLYGSITIDTIQGQKRALRRQQEFLKSSGVPWANVLVAHLIDSARKSGLKYVFLAKPKQQAHVRDSADPEATEKLFYSIKTKFKFKEVPAPKKLFSDEMLKRKEVPPELYWALQYRRHTHWMLRLK